MYTYSCREVCLEIGHSICSCGVVLLGIELYMISVSAVGLGM